MTVTGNWGVAECITFITLTTQHALKWQYLIWLLHHVQLHNKSNIIDFNALDHIRTLIFMLWASQGLQVLQFYPELGLLSV